MEVALLQLHPEDLPQLRAVTGGVQPHHRQAATVGPAQSGDHLDRGGLAGAVGAQDPEGLAPEDVQADAIDSDRSLVSLGEVLDRKSTRLNSSHVAISYAVF